MAAESAITHFQIVGERCSGTNYIAQLMKTNFNLETAILFHKHTPGFKDLSNTDHVLYLVIVREAYEWANSLRKVPHHLVVRDNFLHEELKNDKRIEIPNNMYVNCDFSKKYFENIMKLRNYKAKYMLFDFPKTVKHCIRMRYEDLRDHNIAMLERLEKMFHLERKHEHLQNVTYYKEQKNREYKPSNKYVLDKKSVLEHPDYDHELEAEILKIKDLL